MRLARALALVAAAVTVIVPAALARGYNSASPSTPEDVQVEIEGTRCTTFTRRTSCYPRSIGEPDQVFRVRGTPQGPPPPVVSPEYAVSDPGGGSQSAPSLAFDGTNYLAAWEE